MEDVAVKIVSYLINQSYLMRTSRWWRRVVLRSEQAMALNVNVGRAEVGLAPWLAQRKKLSVLLLSYAIPLTNAELHAVQFFQALGAHAASLDWLCINGSTPIDLVIVELRNFHNLQFLRMDFSNNTSMRNLSIVEFFKVCRGIQMECFSLETSTASSFFGSEPITY